MNGMKNMTMEENMKTNEWPWREEEEEEHVMKKKNNENEIWIYEEWQNNMSEMKIMCSNEDRRKTNEEWTNEGKTAENVTMVCVKGENTVRENNEDSEHERRKKYENNIIWRRLMKKTFNEW